MWSPFRTVTEPPHSGLSDEREGPAKGRSKFLGGVAGKEEVRRWGPSAFCSGHRKGETMNRTMRITTLAALASLTIVAGCSQSRFGGPGFAALQPAPSPVIAAPAGSVQTGALPPVTASGVQPRSLPQVGQQQPLPGQPDPTAQNVQVASIDPQAGAGQPAAAQTATPVGQAVSANTFIGNWQTSVNGQSCATFFGLTDLGSGLLGGTRGCPGELAKFRTWKVAGNQATLRDASGATVATLTKTGDKQFSGVTAGGQGFTLSR